MIRRPSVVVDQPAFSCVGEVPLNLSPGHSEVASVLLPRQLGERDEVVVTPLLRRAAPVALGAADDDPGAGGQPAGHALEQFGAGARGVHDCPASDLASERAADVWRSTFSTPRTPSHDRMRTSTGVPSGAVAVSHTPLFGRQQGCGRTRHPSTTSSSATSSPGSSVASTVEPTMPDMSAIGQDSQAGKTEPLLRMRDAAELLQVSERSVRRMIARGDLPSIRLGGARRIRVRDIRDLIERGTR